MTKIVCVTDSTNANIKFFALKNTDWPWERLCKEFDNIDNGSRRSLLGRFYDFQAFIKARGAIEIDLPTIDFPDYPDHLDD